MSYVKCDDMEKLICEVLFRGRAVPDGYYLGLGSGPLPAENATLADLTEVVGGGYARAFLSNGVIDFPSLIQQDGDWKVTSVVKNFAASTDWTEAEYGFLCSVETGTDGELYCASGFDAFAQAAGDDFDAVFEYQDA